MSGKDTVRYYWWYVIASLPPIASRCRSMRSELLESFLGPMEEA
jgi:hypothetical protein